MPWRENGRRRIKRFDTPDEAEAFERSDVDGRALFAAASRRYRERNGNSPGSGVHGLGDIVLVGPVKDARRRGVPAPRPLPDRLVPTAPSGRMAASGG